MDDAGRRTLDHVVVPRRQPGLAVLERYFPSPAPNILDAELTSFGSAGDTVLDPWAGTGWTGRRAIQHSMRAVAAEPSPFAQLEAVALLRSPDPVMLDTAFTQLATSRRVDVPLSQHIQELYATRCGTCRRPVIAEQFIWPRGAPAPMRKIYRCANCHASVGGPDERSSDVDATDLAKLGLEASTVSRARAEVGTTLSVDDLDDLPPAPTGLTGPVEPGDGPNTPLGEPGGPPAPTPAALQGTVPPLDPSPRWA